MMGLRNSRKNSRHQASGTSTDGDKKMKVSFWSKARVLKIAQTIFFFTWVLEMSLGFWTMISVFLFLMFQMLFPYEEFVKFFQCDFFDLSPRGLFNCGNRYQLPAFVFFWQYLVPSLLTTKRQFIKYNIIGAVKHDHPTEPINRSSYWMTIFGCNFACWRWTIPTFLVSL